jgi:hypothetical protein
MTRRIRYRVGQFLRALTARVSDEEVARATHALTPRAQALFRRQATQDRRHALAVCRALQRAGYEDAHLLTAALLHDAGKAAARISAVHRSIIVLLGRFAPALLARLSRGAAEGWRRPLVVHARHAEIGARWAEEAGCSPLTVDLIRRHEQEPTDERDRLLAALQAADDAN